MVEFDRVRELVDRKGTFTFSTNLKQKKRVPAFALKIHIKNKTLIEFVRDTLKLRNRIYEYNHQKNDGYKRGPQAMLIVREMGQLKNIIVPLFYKKLRGVKAIKLEKWIEKIGSDPYVPETYKFIHKIYKAGFYDKNPKF